MYIDFGLDQLRFAGLIPERVQKSQYNIGFQPTIINGDGGCRLWQPVQTGCLVLGWRSLGAVLRPSTEPGELSQWLCHDDSKINIVLDIV